jgi:predicted PurR-regulated permease PerM
MTLNRIPPYIRAVYLSLLVIIIVFFMIMAKPILVPLLIAGYVAMLMTSFCNRLERWKFPRTLAAFIALLLCTVVVSGIVYFIITQLQHFTADLETNIAGDLDRFVVRVDHAVHDTLGLDMGMDRGFEPKKLLELIKPENMSTSKLLGRALGTLSGLLLLPIFVFFLLIYRDHFAVFADKLFAREKQSELMAHIASIRKLVHAYLAGAGKVMLILAIVDSSILLLLGIKHAIFFGMVAGMLNIIPYLGPFLGAIMPFTFALLTKDSLFYPFAVSACFGLVHLAETTWLTPKITGSNVSLNAFMTFLGLLIGGSIWGIVGMILIIPTIAILKKLFELTPDTQPYAYLLGEEDGHWLKRHHAAKSGKA